jgi:hypothetical protein
MKVNVTKLISFDIVSDPGFLSARFQGYIEKEEINIIRKRKISSITNLVLPLS